MNWRPSFFLGCPSRPAPPHPRPAILAPVRVARHWDGFHGDDADAIKEAQGERRGGDRRSEEFQGGTNSTLKKRSEVPRHCGDPCGLRQREDLGASREDRRQSEERRSGADFVHDCDLLISVGTLKPFGCARLTGSAFVAFPTARFICHCHCVVRACKDRARRICGRL